MVFGPLDAKLLRLAKSHRLTYSRYVDDLTFSASNPGAFRDGLGVNMEGIFILRDAQQLSPSLTSMFAADGFQINPNKVWASTRSVRQQVTGLVTNKKVNVPKIFFRNLRATVHAIEKYGEAYAEKTYLDKYRTSGSASLRLHVLGKLAYLGHITEYDKRYTVLAERVSTLFPDATIKVPFKDRERSVYVIETAIDGDSGTAFHIGDGYFLTAAHLFPPGDDFLPASLHCPSHFPEPLTASVLNVDHMLDVVLLKANSTIVARPAISSSARTPRVRDVVEALGFPNYTSGNTCSYIGAAITSRGKILGVHRHKVDRPWSHGMSGAPVFDNAGVCIGIVCTGPQEGHHDGPFSVSFTGYNDMQNLIGGWLEDAPSAPDASIISGVTVAP